MAKSAQVPVLAVARGQVSNRPDSLAIEEPLAIQVSHGPLAQRSRVTLVVTMRTPGHDEDLACGWLWSEGLLNADCRLISVTPNQSESSVRVEFSPETFLDMEGAGRFGVMSSACGVCGKTTLEAVARRCEPLAPAHFRLNWQVVSTLPKLLLNSQMGFNQTGGLHAAGLFNLKGELVAVREDVGRHNALDKLIGHAYRKGLLPLSESIILMSSRGSFELVQKAAMAGVPILATVGAPSSLAVELAQELGLTLLGFVRDDRFNIYTGEERLALNEPLP